MATRIVYHSMSEWQFGRGGWCSQGQVRSMGGGLASGDAATCRARPRCEHSIGVSSYSDTTTSRGLPAAPAAQPVSKIALCTCAPARGCRAFEKSKRPVPPWPSQRSVKCDQLKHKQLVGSGAATVVISSLIARIAMGAEQDLFDNPTSKLRYEAFSRLQAAAVGEHNWRRRAIARRALALHPPGLGLPVREPSAAACSHDSTRTRSLWRVMQPPHP